MSGLGKVLLSPVGAAIGLFKRPKVPSPAQSVLMPRGITRNDAVDARMRDDERRRRRGVGANILTGSRGAEATTAGGKVLLGQ